MNDHPQATDQTSRKTDPLMYIAPVAFGAALLMIIVSMTMPADFEEPTWFMPTLFAYGLAMHFGSGHAIKRINQSLRAHGKQLKRDYAFAIRHLITWPAVCVPFIAYGEAMKASAWLDFLPLTGRWLVWMAVIAAPLIIALYFLFQHLSDTHMVEPDEDRHEGT